MGISDRFITQAILMPKPRPEANTVMLLLDNLNPHFIHEYIDKTLYIGKVYILYFATKSDDFN